MASAEIILRCKARVGTMLKDKWHLDGLLGVGGSAAVYAATHRNQTRAAIKLLHPELATETEFVKRFLREGYAANVVKHPGVVSILDDDKTDEGAVYIVMELLEGYTLERRLRKEPILPTRDALQIGEDLLDILAAAHEKGIVHRDIKPANLFITNTKRLVLLDFGIARIAELGIGSTQQGLALGTPAYMSPEQARGRWDEVDARSDLFSVGATLWTLLTGKRTRASGTSNEELMLAMTEPMTPLELVAPQLSSEVAKVIDRAVAFDPKDRWQNARTMQQALRLAALLERASLPTGEPEDFLSDISPITGPHTASVNLPNATPVRVPTPFTAVPPSTISSSYPAMDDLAKPGRLSDSRYDALGARPARPRMTSTPTPPPAVASSPLLPPLRSPSLTSGSHLAVGFEDAEKVIPPEPPKPKPKSNTLGIVIFVVLVLAGAIAAAYFTHSIDRYLPRALRHYAPAG